MPFPTIRSLVTVWTKPRSTIRGILDSPASHWDFIIAAIGGISESLFELLLSENNPPKSIALSLFRAFVIGSSFGILQAYVLGGVYYSAGRVLGGKGSYVELRRAVAWSGGLLASWTGLISLLLIIGTGGSVLDGRNILKGVNSLDGFLRGGLLVLYITWGLVAFLRSIAEAHRFSVWKSILSFLIVLFVLGGVLVLAVLALS